MSEIDLLKVIELYRRERKHETIKFGDYKKIKSLNLASFILLLKHYIEKVKIHFVIFFMNLMSQNTT